MRCLITGGTGSVAQAYIDYLLDKDNTSYRLGKLHLEYITVLSRDELKQHLLKNGKYKNEKKIKWKVGDVRDKDTLAELFINHNIVIHSAAMKHVPACEENPIESIKTNVLSAKNIVELLKTEKYSISKLVMCSTDKACSPSTVMGLSKALAERTIINSAGEINCAANCVRYGNLFESSGSVLHTFIEQAKTKKVITLTSDKMTRYVNTLQESAETIQYALDISGSGNIIVKPGFAVNMRDVASVVWRYFNDTEPKIEITGIRRSEKLSESLLSYDEFLASRQNEDYIYINPKWHDSKKLKQPYYDKCVSSSKSVLSAPETEEEITKMIENIENGRKEVLLSR